MSPPPRSTRKTPRQATSLVAFEPAPVPEDDDPLLAFAPYLHPCPRRNSITPDKQRAFIAALAATGIVSQAARTIGKSLEALYKLRARRGAEGFAAAWEQAAERGLDRLEDCALELALAGEELPIVSAGKLLGTYRKHNFAHLRFMLSQRRPDRYGGRAGPADLLALAPDDPVLVKLRAQWLAEYEAEQDRMTEAERLANEAFLTKLTHRYEVLRQKALAIEQGVWFDAEAAAAAVCDAGNAADHAAPD